MVCVSHSDNPAIQVAFRKLHARFPGIDVLTVLRNQDEKAFMIKIRLPKGETIYGKYKIGRRAKSEFDLECRCIGMIKTMLRSHPFHG